MPVRSILLSMALALLASCGGGGDVPLPAARAQVAPVEIAHLHFILRPDSQGQWFIQNDSQNLAHEAGAGGLVTLTAEVYRELVMAARQWEAANFGSPSFHSRLITMDPPKMDMARLLNLVWGWFDSTGAWHHNPCLMMSREEQLADNIARGLMSPPADPANPPTLGASGA